MSRGPAIINRVLGYMEHETGGIAVSTQAIAEALELDEEKVRQSLRNHILSRRTVGDAKVEHLGGYMYRWIVDGATGEAGEEIDLTLNPPRQRAPRKVNGMARLLAAQDALANAQRELEEAIAAVDEEARELRVKAHAYDRISRITAS